MEQKTSEDRPTALAYLSALTRIGFTTACYWLVGLTPEENHGTKGAAWASIHAYRWAAWHFRKYLKYSDDSWARAALAWCYAQLGMIESAVGHYRLAYARNKNPEIAVYLAQAEADFGNFDAAQRLYEEASARRNDLRSEALAEFAALDDRLRTRSAAGDVPQSAMPVNMPLQPTSGAGAPR
jgi:tetratricopeptide (TPR) repeat protein